MSFYDPETALLVTASPFFEKPASSVATRRFSVIDPSNHTGHCTEAKDVGSRAEAGKQDESMSTSTTDTYGRTARSTRKFSVLEPLTSACTKDEKLENETIKVNKSRVVEQEPKEVRHAIANQPVESCSSSIREPSGGKCEDEFRMAAEETALQPTPASPKSNPHPRGDTASQQDVAQTTASSMVTALLEALLPILPAVSPLEPQLSQSPLDFVPPTPSPSRCVTSESTRSLSNSGLPFGYFNTDTLSVPPTAEEATPSSIELSLIPDVLPPVVLSSSVADGAGASSPLESNGCISTTVDDSNSPTADSEPVEPPVNNAAAAPGEAAAANSIELTLLPDVWPPVTVQSLVSGDAMVSNGTSVSAHDSHIEEVPTVDAAEAPSLANGHTTEDSITVPSVPESNGHTSTVDSSHTTPPTHSVEQTAVAPVEILTPPSSTQEGETSDISLSLIPDSIPPVVVPTPALEMNGHASNTIDDSHGALHTDPIEQLSNVISHTLAPIEFSAELPATEVEGGGANGVHVDTIDVHSTGNSVVVPASTSVPVPSSRKEPAVSASVKRTGKVMEPKPEDDKKVQENSAMWVHIGVAALVTVALVGIVIVRRRRL